MSTFRTLLDSESAASAPEFAFAELARRIITGQIVAGSRLTEEQLAKDLGVSRTPLRTALDRLEASRMVVRQRNRSIYVAPMAVEEIRELSELRARIEGLVAHRAAERVRAEGLSLDRIAMMAEDADRSLADPQAINRLGREFHKELVRLSGLTHVSGLLENIYLNLERYRYVLSEEAGRMNNRIREHQGIVDAVRAGEPERAEALMRAHIQSGLDFYIERLDIAGR